jgi:hypothetical protein
MSSLKGKLNQEIQGKVTRWASKQQKTNKDPKTNKKLTQKKPKCNSIQNQKQRENFQKKKQKNSHSKERKILEKDIENFQ